MLYIYTYNFIHVGMSDTTSAIERELQQAYEEKKNHIINNKQQI